MLLPPMSARAAERDLVEVTLEARPYRFPAVTGAQFMGLAYNGRVPGQLLRVRYGQTFRARFINRTGGPSTVHWHGMILPNDMDGVPYVTQPPVPDGGEFTYTFKPNPPGFRWYHAHVGDELALGLFGPFIVEEPADPRADVEVVLVLHDVPDMQSFRAALAGKSAAKMDVPPGLGMSMPGMSASPGMPAMPGMRGLSAMRGMSRGSAMRGGHAMSDEVAYLSHCIGGAAYPHMRPIIVKVGQTVRLRILNASPTLTHYLRLAGHRLRVTHSDGNLLARGITVDALRLGVGERYDAWFEVTRPGAWLLESLMGDTHDHRQAVLIRTPEAARLTPERPSPWLEGVEYFNYLLDGEPEPPQSLDTPDPYGPIDLRTVLTLGGGQPGQWHWTIDGKYWPNTPKIRVHRNDRVLIHFKNPTDMDHPMHLHGHVFELVALSGKRLKNPLAKDTTLVPANGGTATWRFTANAPPGRWVLHCHDLVHLIDGMMTEVVYV